MNIQELVDLAKERIRKVPSDGSTCGLCDRHVDGGIAFSVTIRLPIIGLQDKHFCPDPCAEIIGRRIQEVLLEDLG